MRKQTIHQFYFLGINIYKRIRISEKELSTKNEYDKELLVGLYPLVKYPKLEFDYISLYQQKDWDKTADELFYKAFMHLLFVKAIKIYSFKDKNNILGIFNFKANGFYLKRNNSFTTEDIFLNLILKSVKEINKEYQNKSNLKYNVQYLIDEFLGANNNEHNRPEKKFITRLIKRYTRKHNWIELEKETKYFGLVSNYKVKVEDTRLLFLNDSFRSLSSISLVEKRNNIHLKDFENALSKIVKKDFKNRYPSNDSDID